MPANFTAPVLIDGLDVTAAGMSRAAIRGPLPGGEIWYVSNRSGVENGDGKSADKPLAAMFGTNGALARLRNRVNCGDCIYVLPGHVESVTAADMASDTGTAAGFSIVGLGTGTQRPQFNWIGANSTWLIDTANIEIANCQLYLAGAVAATTQTVVTPITVSAAGFRLINNYINWGIDTNTGCGSTLGAIAFTTAADFCEIYGNYFENTDVAGTLAVTCLSINGADQIQIVGNQFFGATTATTVGPVHFLTTLSANVVIKYNYIENKIASSTIAVSSAIAGVTGVVAFNQFRVNSGIVAVTASTNMSTTVYQNYTADTVNQNGALDVAGGTST